MALEQRWLSAEQVAASRHITVAELEQLVAEANFPGPTRFEGRQPRWDKIIAANPAPYLLPTPHQTGPNRGSRSIHLKHLREEVACWVWEHGSARVPMDAAGRTINGQTFPLGQRVCALRTSYRMGRLSEAEAAMFEDLPRWTWDATDAEWRDRFSDVTSRWPHKTNSRDRQWLASQRLRRHKLRPEWLALMRSIPGLMEAPAKSRTHMFIDAARTWLKQNRRHTMLDVLVATTVMVETPNGGMERFPLGERAVYYRRRYRGLEGSQPLSLDEVALFEELPGWRWEGTSERRRHLRAIYGQGPLVHEDDYEQARQKIEADMEAAIASDAANRIRHARMLAEAAEKALQEATAAAEAARETHQEAERARIDAEQDMDDAQKVRRSCGVQLSNARRRVQRQPESASAEAREQVTQGLEAAIARQAEVREDHLQARRRHREAEKVAARAALAAEQAQQDLERAITANMEAQMNVEQAEQQQP